MALARDLERLLGKDRVSIASTTLAEHAADRWFASRIPDVVVFAGSTEDVSKLLRFAHRRGIPVTPRGAGCGYVGGCVHGRRHALSLARMKHQGINFATRWPWSAGVITAPCQPRRGKAAFYRPIPRA